MARLTKLWNMIYNNSHRWNIFEILQKCKRINIENPLFLTHIHITNFTNLHFQCHLSCSPWDIVKMPRMELPSRTMPLVLGVTPQPPSAEQSVTSSPALSRALNVIPLWWPVMFASSCLVWRITLSQVGRRNLKPLLRRSEVM